MAKSVAKKSAKVAKSATKAVAKKSAAPVAKKSTKAVATKEAKKPNEFHAALIALMVRKDGATIQDFQGVDGFNIPSMAALKIAERHGYKTSAVKEPGKRTVYKAVRP
jgi:hypothetical protein